MSKSCNTCLSFHVSFHAFCWNRSAAIVLQLPTLLHIVNVRTLERRHWKVISSLHSEVHLVIEDKHMRVTLVRMNGMYKLMVFSTADISLWSMLDGMTGGNCECMTKRYGHGKGSGMNNCQVATSKLVAMESC